MRALWSLLCRQRCPACAAPVEGVGDQGEGARPEQSWCGACRVLLEPLSPDAFGYFAYQGPLKDAIHRWKIDRAEWVGRALGQLLVSRLQPLRARVKSVVPVPSSALKLAHRGFAPAGVLARYAANYLGVPCVFALKRSGPRMAQSSLGRDARLLNVREAFVCSKVAPSPVLLIDDVSTTGATLREAAHTLRDAGVQDIVTKALAHSGEA